MRTPQTRLRIVCEGYDDRAFWQGYLKHHLKWSERMDLPYAKGEFIFSKGDAAIYVFPANGDRTVVAKRVAKL